MAIIQRSASKIPTSFSAQIMRNKKKTKETFFNPIETSIWIFFSHKKKHPQSSKHAINSVRYRILFTLSLFMRKNYAHLHSSYSSWNHKISFDEKRAFENFGNIKRKSSHWRLNEERALKTFLHILWNTSRLGGFVICYPLQESQLVQRTYSCANSKQC